MNQSEDDAWFKANPDRTYRVREAKESERLATATIHKLVLVKKGSCRTFPSNNLHLEMSEEVCAMFWKSFVNSRGKHFGVSNGLILPKGVHRRGLQRLNYGNHLAAHGYKGR